MSVKKSVGRPPETDGQGKQVIKGHVTLLLPVTLKEFLKKQPNMNMSALFTRVVTSLYLGQICPRCYDDDGVRSTHVGTYCENCDKGSGNSFFIWNQCPSCETYYNVKNMANNKWDDETNKPILDCFECMGKPNYAREDRLSDNPTPVEPIKLIADPKEDTDSELVQ